ncbi:hypothetical protein RSSM_02178 [Rhodopirellula sallentina SM41]|uniref:Uncharacterized protein n=1 Tax=Rhodopirellula sallentina SM41 TaxID=1263870 RepID=M5UK37_9BACT|nr:hypothetical protein RSSM_02178 [Rhodopirellula sallentina SM41]
MDRAADRTERGEVPTNRYSRYVQRQNVAALTREFADESFWSGVSSNDGASQYDAAIGARAPAAWA